MKTLHALRIGLASTGAAFAFIVVSLLAPPMAHAALTSQMGVGSTGSNVTQLQQFLATNPQIYPAGVVSGYYGALTEAAVTQFQVVYGISQVGNVGPITEAKMNEIMASGLGLDNMAPAMSDLSVSQVNPTTANVSWMANKPVRGQVFYSTSPIQSNEATGAYQLPYIGGTAASVNSNTGVSNSQSVQLSDLQPNTFYYFITRSIDQSGNVSMSMTQSFQTN
jgi:peptidoglycan hydrolase-like protein with peptidoglycan-binding domain